MRKWLEYLTQNYPYYCNLPIQWQQLQKLPEDGNISDRIQRVTLQQPTRTNLDQTGGSSQQEEDAGEEAEEAIASELEDGPETSGETGAVDGDGDDDHQEDIFVPLPLQNVEGLDADQIREFVTDGGLPPSGRENNVVMSQGGNPMNDYDTLYLQSMDFPTFFPPSPWPWGESVGKAICRRYGVS